MNNILKKSLAILLVLSNIFLFACTSVNSFDPIKFLELELRSSYLNEHSTELIDMYSETYEISDLEQIYAENVAREAEYFLGYSGSLVEELSPETIAKANGIFDQIYQKINFTVNDMTHDENVYTLNVSVKPVDIIIKTMTTEFISSILDEIKDGTFETEAELEEFYANAFLDELSKNLSSIEYLEPVNITISIDETQDGFVIRKEDLENFRSKVIVYTE